MNETLNISGALLVKLFGRRGFELERFRERATEVRGIGVQQAVIGLLDTIAEQLQEWEIKPAATEGYRTAEVTLGGVDTRDLSSQTMESGTPGLFFIGEVIDVTGHLGGFNFQWAWSSGYAAGQAL